MTRDLRAYARHTNIRLVAGFVALLLIVGDGLIYLLYGRAAAISGLLCIGLGLLPLSLIALSLTLIDRAVRRYNDE